MARFSGDVGFGIAEETFPNSGVWVDRMSKRNYFGDVIRNTRQLEQGDKVNPNILVGNSISIVADQYATEHFLSIKYVRWEGVLWTVTSVEVRRPRLILDLGEVYNGPTE
jgi:hypothetical protein